MSPQELLVALLDYLVHKPYCSVFEEHEPGECDCGLMPLMAQIEDDSLKESLRGYGHEV